MPRPARTPAAAIAVIAAMLLAAGCGGDDGDDTGGAPRDSAPATPRTVTPPEPDPELADELGDELRALTTAGCSLGTYEEGEPEHVEEDAELPSKPFPPTSGPHYGDWAPYGLYDEPVADGYAVHNLEHGGVTVWLGTKVEDEARAAIADLLDRDEKWLVAPRRDLDGLFSAAWAKGLWCPPAALAKLEPDALADGLDAWYDEVESTGSEAEKDVPAYAGAMREPSPERDISTESPF